MKKCCIILLMFIVSWLTVTAQPVRVLFIGNSYTYVNSLPQLLHDVALSFGDTILFDSSTPGGYTLEQHSTYANTLNKITSQQWDYVILQEQSQRPSFSPSQVAIEVLPYAMLLDSLIHDNNPCTETVFYMTWGRKNGDASNCAVYPPVCTYEGMQARLRESYLLMGQQNGATVSPVGAAWKAVRDLNPSFDLYDPDESHPSIYGSYLAACTFYSTLFHKSPLGCSFISSLSPADAALLQDRASVVAFDSLSTWYQYGTIPFAGFSYQQNGLTVQFQDESLNATSYNWDFGDGGTSIFANPLHHYIAPGTYPVSLNIVSNCRNDTYSDTLVVTTTGLNEVVDNCTNLWYDAGRKVIRLNCEREVKAVRIVGLDGRQVYVYDGPVYNSAVPAQLNQTGVFVAEVITANGIFRKPIFVY
ncbi:MAG TPA: PKD domain-containing protein [Bacteroidia bacterium]|nr:PKD domain-containing protein [Bacteroidia bacterium]